MNRFKSLTGALAALMLFALTALAIQAGDAPAAAKQCPPDCAKPCCADKAKPKACPPDCAKPCCADKAEAPKACCPAMADGAKGPVKAALGQPAPEFTLQDTNGKAHSLSGFKGKEAVLIWTNPDCPFVQRHAKAGTVAALAAKYADKGVAFVQIDSTSPDKGGTAERAKAAAAGLPASLPMLLDPAGAAGRAFGAKTTPHVFIVDKAGKLVYQGAIDNDPRGALADADKVDYVSRTLDAVLAGQPVATPSTKPYGCSVKLAEAAASE
jgi:peroxiredoxin